MRSPRRWCAATIAISLCNLSSWQAPDGGSVADFVRLVRGSPGMIERLVIEAPPGRNLNVGDLMIAGTPGGHDLLVGQNDAPDENRVRRCTIFGSGFQQAAVATDAQWIVPTGGGYFFIPSISALTNVIAG
jgi:hypothetical protein